MPLSRTFNAQDGQVASGTAGPEAIITDFDSTMSEVNTHVAAPSPHTGHAASDHNHDGDYAATGHNHDGTYAATGHNHTGTYAPNSHTHTVSEVTNAVDGVSTSKITVSTSDPSGGSNGDIWIKIP